MREEPEAFNSAVMGWLEQVEQTSGSAQPTQASLQGGRQTRRAE
jgi:hypothetical protein